MFIFLLNFIPNTNANVTSNDCQKLLDSDLFNVNTYRKYNKDLQAQTDDNKLRLHWCQFGINEGRQASEVFSSKEFLSLNPNLQSMLGQNYKAAAILYITSPNYGRQVSPGVKIGSAPFF